jgi:hypothetical protein
MIPFKAAKDQDDAYGQHMDELAKRIGHVLDGETMFDSASACAAAIAFATKGLPNEKRELVLEKLNQFIRKCWDVN